MPQPEKVVRVKDFTKNLSTATDHHELNELFDAIAQSVNDLIRRQALLLRDDDTFTVEYIAEGNLTLELQAKVNEPGPEGPEGPAGPQGPQGIQGPAGQDGAAGSVRKMADSTGGSRYGAITGAIDGANTTYFLPEPYVAGTVKWWWNGQLQPDGAISESNPTTGQVIASFAPASGYLSAEYEPQ